MATRAAMGGDGFMATKNRAGGCGDAYAASEMNRGGGGRRENPELSVCSAEEKG